jgi:hypothetical protein
MEASSIVNDVFYFLLNVSSPLFVLVCFPRIPKVRCNAAVQVQTKGVVLNKELRARDCLENYTPRKQKDVS